LKPVAYGILIITFLLILYLTIGYIRFAGKMKFLEDVKQNLTADKHSFLQPENALEQEYQVMISSLYDIIQNHVERLEKTHTEQVEYYTMWVHQIKTPISAMRLALQSSGAGEHRELMEQELFKIEQYVELALQYTKMKNLSSDLVIRDYPLEEVVNQSIRKYAQLFIYKKLSVHIEEFHATVTTDSKWLSFLLEQLISNAIKYTNQGGVEITYHDKTLKITDSGIGIRGEDTQRIFEKGYTGYNGRVDKKASGIGLYLAKKVADTLAIKLSISSEVGKGTVVAVTFPEDSVVYHNSVDC
jgi:signal transduction histidine kinase